MTFTEIVTNVMNRLNLTSTEARTRVGVDVNRCYKRVTSDIGLLTSRRENFDLTLDPDDIDSILPDVIVTGCEKVLRVTLDVNPNGFRILPEMTYDEITTFKLTRGLPYAYAVKRMSPQQVTLTLNTYPTIPFLVHIEGYELADTLSGDLEPAFPESFHDVLEEGAMSIELRKMEKPQLAEIAEAEYEKRLSALRYFIAKSAYLDQYQGKDRQNTFWNRGQFGRGFYWWGN